MKLNIDLEIKGPELALTKASEPSPRAYYPELHLEGDEEFDLPKEGTLTVKYREVSKRESNRQGSESYSCDLEILELVSVESAKDIRPSKRDRSTEDALDDLANEKGKEY